MERSLQGDTDSDSSILSEDVLSSTYPVKPRKTPRGPAVQKQQAPTPSETDIGEREYDAKTIEQTLAFVDAIKRSKKDLYTAECERETLECQGVVSCYLLLRHTDCMNNLL